MDRGTFAEKAQLLFRAGRRCLIYDTADMHLAIVQAVIADLTALVEEYEEAGDD